MAHLPVLPSTSDRDLFARHLEDLVRYTDRLLEGRCKRTTRFDADLDATLRIFKPLFTAWKAEILFALYVHGPSRFGVVKRRLGPISSRVLSDKLAALQEEGLVTKQVDGQYAEYRLLAPGEIVARHLHPLLFYLHTAGTGHDQRIATK
jgi:DNA-binding HxlR family transcriptional regulator